MFSIIAWLGFKCLGGEESTDEAGWESIGEVEGRREPGCVTKELNLVGSGSPLGAEERPSYPPL